MTTLSASLLLITWAAAPPPPRLWVDSSVPVSRVEAPHIEPSLAAHPTEAGVLVGAGVFFEGEEPAVTSFHSRDGGRTWTEVPLPGCRIDPWVEVSPRGTVFLSCMAQAGGATLVFRSTDGGATWPGPASVPLGVRGGPPDRPVLVVGHSAATADRMFLAQGQGFEDAAGSTRLYGPTISRSHDGGVSFGEPHFVRHNTLHQQPIDAVILPDGQVAVFFMDYLTPSRNFLRHRRTWMVRSTDGPEHFSVPTLVHEQVAQEMPWSVALDPSRGPCGRLYLVMDGVWFREPATPEVLAASDVPGLSLIQSDDCGSRWSRPVPVPGDRSPGNRETPTVAVNAQGVVGVSWYDTRHSPDALCFDVYFAASFDGGKSFTPGQRLTDSTSCPRQSAHPGLARRWAFGGDYSGLAAAADGRFHVLWADTQDGVYRLRTTRVTPTLEP